MFNERRHRVEKRLQGCIFLLRRMPTPPWVFSERKGEQSQIIRVAKLKAASHWAQTVKVAWQRE